ncbi:DUF7573 domain-containing protein [Natronoglomus mannanivorans]|uniref:DUF7573 domain-containing protein n=1 Tax=Natronoglomus mannanivorans TaxID=2979990 RepID=A0AAP2Z3M0_9EURY|nr:hypothetical protein [Halobacteria archaeon AArc-xg1-1]
MTEDQTLTDFLQGGRDESTERDGDGGSSEMSGERTTADREGESCDGENETGTDGEDDSDVAEIEPATTTYAWGSYVCAVCETSVERVWQRGDGDETDGNQDDLVCESCKVW